MRSFIPCVIFSVCLIAVSAASAEILARCGELKGHAFFAPSLAVPQAERGWTTDGMTDGQVFITREKTSTGFLYDIVFKDSTGKTKSLRQQGFVVVAINISTHTIHILGVHTGNITEMYVLDTENKLLSLLSHRMGLLRSTKAMVAKCE